MLVRIELNWMAGSIDGLGHEHAEKPLSKTTDMPGTPPKGTYLELRLPDGHDEYFPGAPSVEEIRWEENEPNVFTVETNTTRILISANEFRRLMAPLGWS